MEIKEYDVVALTEESQAIHKETEQPILLKRNKDKSEQFSWALTIRLTWLILQMLKEKPMQWKPFQPQN